MEYFKIKTLFENSRILNPEKSIKYSLNKVRCHSRFESIEHFACKAVISLLAIKKSKIILTEAECRNGRILDVLQLSKNGELVSYEVESTKNRKDDVEGVDIVEIPLSKMPEDARKGLISLEKWLEGYLI